jgi:hypothetical protein
LSVKVQAFLTEIRWFGLAQLQFLCPDEGEPVLIDFNGRMYGSLEFANACGMRAMDTWARLATGRSATPSEMVVGLRYQALEGDLKWAMTQPGMKRFREVGDCLVEAFGAVHPILSWSDPLPLLAYLARLPGRALEARKQATSL